MIWKRKSSLLVSSAVLLMGIAGCASVKKEVDIVWPLPPDEPRIKYVKSLRSEKDLGKEGGIGEALLGEDKANALIRPYGCATDAGGRIYATDVGRVFVFDEKNKKVSFIGDDANTGKLAVPMGIVISHDGKVYVADAKRKRVFAYDAKGNLITGFGKTGELDTPTGIAIDEKRGRLYVVDTKKHAILVFALADGKLLKTIGKRGGEPGTFNLPTNIIVDREGNLYVVDTGNFRVQILDPDGKPIKSIGSLGDKPGNFSRPKGIALDSEDNLYVVDTTFNNIQVFNKKGELLIFIGEGGFAPGRFNSPSGICIDADDRIIVADGMNGRLEILQYMSEKWKKEHPEIPKWVAPKIETPKAETPKPAEKK